MRWHGGVAVERVLALHVKRRQLQLQVAAAAEAVGNDLHATTTPAAGGRTMLMCHLRPGRRRRRLSLLCCERRASSLLPRNYRPAAGSIDHHLTLRLCSSACTAFGCLLPRPAGCSYVSVAMRFLL